MSEETQSKSDIVNELVNQNGVFQAQLIGLQLGNAETPPQMMFVVPGTKIRFALPAGSSSVINRFKDQIGSSCTLVLLPENVGEAG